MQRRICGRKTRGGYPCKISPMRGQTVCRMHGGMAPQNIKTAEERLRAMVHPAISGLAELINKADSDSVRLSAIRDLLDRTGYKLPDKLETSGDSTIRVEYADVATPLMRLADERGNGHAD